MCIRDRLQTEPPDFGWLFLTAQRYLPYETLSHRTVADIRQFFHREIVVPVAEMAVHLDALALINHFV